MNNPIIPLFDVDWTLLQGNNKAHDGAHNYAFSEVYKMPNARKHDINPNGMTDRQIIYEVLKTHGLSEDDITSKVDAAIDAMTEYFHSHEEEAEYVPMKGVVELLDILKAKRVKCGLLTGNIESVGWRKLELAGIRDYFTFGAFGSMARVRSKLIDVARQKAEAYYREGFLTDQFLIVGDAPLDVACAKEGRIKSIAVASGVFSRDDLMNAGADLVLDDLINPEAFLEFIGV
ncbi:HAD hydrolase-like protein [candidate division WWE3 bacterium]|uniref:HAD hydrolase-like protein n=1 Tax=candidate division WWE3 bacterium TaxID=2053526 RepID=A0A955LJK2_UNCKA|nr:HAD hydrolase-like protein [candidate division WWE3 bacterium]